VAALIMTGGALAACSSSSSSSTTSTTRSSKTSATKASTSTTRSTASTSTGSSTTTGTATCAPTDLSGSVVGSSGAAGTIEITVALKSTATTTCTLAGYPGLQLVSSTGAALPTNVVRKGTYSFTAMAPTTVTLPSGQTAYFNVGYSDVPTATETSCPTASMLEVTPPNDVDHLVISATLAPCGGGTLVVSPVFLSTGSNSQTTAPLGA
jgi:hypothetical protein